MGEGMRGPRKQGKVPRRKTALTEPSPGERGDRASAVSVPPIA